eukprot:gene2554-3516_t
MKIFLPQEQEETDILVVGSTCIDYVTNIMNFPEEIQTTIQSSFFMKNFGGKGSNQAAMIAKLCSRPHLNFITCLGNDEDGRNMKENFKKLKFKNVDTNTFLLQETNTTIAQVIVEETGNNRIVLTTGANDFLVENHFNKNWENIKTCSIALFQLEINPDVVLYSLKKAKSEGIYTIFNPAPARKNLSEEFYKYTDLIAPNETEAEILTGIEIKTIEDAIKSATILQSKGVKEILITLGSNGCLYLDSSGKSFHIPSCKVDKVVDTTGAGDCFLGTLTYFLSCKVAMKTGIEYANYIASLAIQKKGAQQKYPTREEIQKMNLEN